jgi:hypothetical protein
LRTLIFGLSPPALCKRVWPIRNELRISNDALTQPVCREARRADDKSSVGEGKQHDIAALKPDGRTAREIGDVARRMPMAECKNKLKLYP